MNNNLYINRHRPYGVSAKHAEAIEKVPACGRPQGLLLPRSEFDEALTSSADVLYGRPKIQSITCLLVIYLK